MARPFPSVEKLGSNVCHCILGTLRRPSWLAARPSPQQLVRVAWIHVLAWRTTEIPHPTSVVYVCDFGTPRLTPPRPSIRFGIWRFVCCIYVCLYLYTRSALVEIMLAKAVVTAAPGSPRTTEE